MQRTMAIGFYFISAILILGVTTVLVGNLIVFGSTMKIRVKFDQIEGLRKGDNVRVDGAQLGKVTDVDLVEGGVMVEARLDKKITFYDDYTVTVDFLSILGGNQLIIRRGTPGKPTKEPLVNGAPLELIGKRKASVIDEVSKAVEDINRGEGTLGKLFKDPSLYDNLTAVTDKINKGEGTLGKLVNDDSLYKDLKVVSDKLAKGEGTIGKIIHDDELYEDMRALTKSLRGTEGVAGKLLNDPEMARKLDQTVTDLSETLASAKNIVKKIERGEGSVGKFIQEESLYNDASEAIRVFGRAARSHVFLGADYLVGNESEMGLARVHIKIWPTDDKYFHVGATALLLDRDGEVAFERGIEQNEDDTEIKPDVQIAYVPALLDKHVTARIGLFEGRPGGALELFWEDFGAFSHPVSLVLETRQAYRDLDDDDIDEGVGKTLQRAYVTFPCWGRGTEKEPLAWWQKMLFNTRVFIGGSRILDDDPEFFAGIGFEYEDEDIRTLVGLIGAAR